MVLRRTLALSDEQRAALEQRRDHDPRPYVRERCAAMLKVADGTSAHAVARSGLLRPRDPDTLYAWLDRFQADGLAGLLAHPQGGYRRHRL
jgi:hypothetical protein